MMCLLLTIHIAWTVICGSMEILHHISLIDGYLNASTDTVISVLSPSNQHDTITD